MTTAFRGWATRKAGNREIWGSAGCYYGMARVVKPETAVVIGSYRGFVPLALGRALADNGAGKVLFIDPSLVDPFLAQSEKSPRSLREIWADEYRTPLPDDAGIRHKTPPTKTR